MKEITIEAAVENIAVVTDFVTAELEQMDCPIKAQTQICIAIDELFGNIAKYAYAPDIGDATVQIEMIEDPLSVIITFIDGGKPFDPLRQTEPNTDLPASERQEGGLGIFLVKKTMSMVDYQYKDGKNILSIRKNF